MNAGWIKLHRWILDSPLMQHSKLLHVYLVLFLRAAYQPQKIKFGGQWATLVPGQAIFSCVGVTRETGISKTSVLRYLGELEELGFIKVKPGKRGSIASIVHWDVGCLEEDSGPPVDRLTPRAGKGLNAPLLANVDRRRSASGPQTDTYKKEKKFNNFNNQQLAEAFEFWQQEMGKPKSKLTAKRYKAIQARFEQGYSIEDIKQAVRGCKLSEFHMGVNDRGRAFNDIELICRTGDKLEQFIEIAVRPPKATSNSRKLSLAEQKENDLEITRQRIRSRSNDCLTLVKND